MARWVKVLVIITLIIVGVAFLEPVEPQFTDSGQDCTDECSFNQCDGAVYESCVVSKSGCKIIQREPITQGACGVTCLDDEHCNVGEKCEKYTCKEQSQQTIMIADKLIESMSDILDQQAKKVENKIFSETNIDAINKMLEQEAEKIERQLSQESISSATSNINGDCPDFSSLSDRVDCKGNSCSFAVISEDGIGKVGKYRLFPWDARPGVFYPYSRAYASCKQGSEKGENVNNFYCVGMYTIIKETDSAGNILSSKEPYVKLVIHNSKIIDTICY